MEERNSKAIEITENILKDFMFSEYDKIEIEGLDSIIALHLQSIDEIVKCDVQTKVINENDTSTETYVFIKWEDSDTPLTFKSITTNKVD